jgi:hypothetical protein
MYLLSINSKVINKRVDVLTFSIIAFIFMSNN